jgi:hypothetical protein
MLDRPAVCILQYQEPASFQTAPKLAKWPSTSRPMFPAQTREWEDSHQQSAPGTGTVRLTCQSRN